jgi:hypothetical protein
MVIKDRVALGAFAGILGSLPQIAVNLISHTFHYTKIYSFTLAGGIFLNSNLTGTAGGMILGTLLWLFTAAFLGLLMVLLLEWTGKDYWWFKGPFVTVIVMHIFIYGFFFNMASCTVIPIDVSTNLSFLIENLVFGVTAGYFVKRCAPETSLPS